MTTSSSEENTWREVLGFDNAPALKEFVQEYRLEFMKLIGCVTLRAQAEIVKSIVDKEIARLENGQWCNDGE
jgi:hypothetical protein